jgi:hypothetical protein
VKLADGMVLEDLEAVAICELLQVWCSQSDFQGRGPNSRGGEIRKEVTGPGKPAQPAAQHCRSSVWAPSHHLPTATASSSVPVALPALWICRACTAVLVLAAVVRRLRERGEIAIYGVKRAPGGFLNGIFEPIRTNRLPGTRRFLLRRHTSATNGRRWCPP